MALSTRSFTSEADGGTPNPNAIGSLLNAEQMGSGSAGNSKETDGSGGRDGGSRGLLQRNPRAGSISGVAAVHAHSEPESPKGRAAVRF